MPLYLGLDSSTQSITAIVIDSDSREIVYEHGINFDAAFPEYGTSNGTLPGDDPQVVHAPPMIWVEALDELMAHLADAVDVAQIVAVSGSGQQHGSIYLNSPIGPLNPDESLKAQIEPLLSRATSPIWMDSSTNAQCNDIRDALGGTSATTAATGSNTFERFTGPQIRKFAQTEPAAYASTVTIALVSSFMSSILAGTTSPIDPGDGAGMNLMDIAARDWHPGALDATAENLAAKLPPIAASGTEIGTINPYFVGKHGFSADCRCIVWSGDNPCSLIGLGLVQPGMLAVSLGTSDTLFGSMAECATDPNAEGHVFGSPNGDYMTLICFKNGSLAREAVKDSFGLDWAGFSEALQSTTPGSGGLMLPWFEPEIVPHVLTPGVHRQNLDESDAAANCRAVVEAQMMSMRIHSEWMGIKPACIYVTGGASANADILQIMANVHGCPVHRFETTNSAALGAALMALQGESGCAWTDAVTGFAEPVAGSEVVPQDEFVGVYHERVEAYRAFEASVLQA